MILGRCTKGKHTQTSEGFSSGLDFEKGRYFYLDSVCVIVCLTMKSILFAVTLNQSLRLITDHRLTFVLIFQFISIHGPS